MRGAVLVGLTALLTAACAGRDFKPPSAQFPVLGRTTRGEILVTYGKPYREGSTVTNGVTLELLTYSYAESGPSDAVVPGVTPARSATFGLHEGVVVSYSYVSAFKADATDFDASKATQLVKGQSRREDVMRLFGFPSGQSIPPAVAAGRTAWSYLYTQVKSRVYQSPLIYQQRLVVTFDEQGVVQDYQLFTYGDR